MSSLPMPNVTISKPTGCGNILVTLVFKEDGSLFKIRPKLGRNGTCANAIVSAAGKLASLAIKHGATVAEVAKKIEGITCQHPCPATGDDNGCTSCCDALAQVIATAENHNKAE